MHLSTFTDCNLRVLMHVATASERRTTIAHTLADLAANRARLAAILHA